MDAVFADGEGHSAEGADGREDHEVFQGGEDPAGCEMDIGEDPLPLWMKAQDDADDNGQKQNLQGEVVGEEVAPAEFGDFWRCADGQAAFVYVAGLDEIGEEDADGQRKR